MFLSFPNDNKNGNILLGEYLDSDVNIKIIFIKDSDIKKITLGSLNLDKLDNFVYENYIDNINVKFEKNSISINVEGKDGDILFLPITYLDGYKSNTHSIFRVFDNFLGIRLNDGNNHIEIDYVPKGMIAGILFSILGIILFILWEKYYCLFDINILNNIFYFIYLLIYFVIIFTFYILMPLFFIKSFF